MKSSTPTKDFAVGKQLRLRSAILGEDRPLLIFTPGDYESAKSSCPAYPVLYLLDGADNFMHVVGVVDYLARKNRIPPMIVVAVGNTDRNRDLTPSHSSLGLYGNHLRFLETSGGADKFFDFFRRELMPYVEKHYRTAPFRLLDGHSLGGLFALDVLQKHPRTFQALISVSPSLWWDDQALLKQTGPAGRTGQFLYLSVGNEGGRHESSIRSFARRLKARAPGGFTWAFKAYPDETHNSVTHRTLYDALAMIFAGWDILERPYDETKVTFEDGERHCRKLSKKYKFKVVLSDVRICFIATRLLFQGHIGESVATLEKGLRLHPTSALCANALAGALVEQGDKKAAIKAYRKVLRLDPNSDSARRALRGLAK
jgi:predicted alpha/beta superfamily hydrolase